MHARSVAAIVLVVALAASGLVVMPGLGAGTLPSYVGLTAAPVTIDGIPLDEASPRAVVVVDRRALIGTEGTPTSGDADAGRSTTSAANGTSTGTAGLGARTMSQQVVVDLHELSDQDRELSPHWGCWIPTTSLPRRARCPTTPRPPNR